MVVGAICFAESDKLSGEELKVRLCGDHFARLVNGNACNTCPSKLENEAAVKALAALNGRSDDDKLTAIANELLSIRRAQQEMYLKVETVGTRVEKIDGKLNGNGAPGIAQRLLVMETKAEQSTKNVGTYVAIATAITSAMISVFGAWR